MSREPGIISHGYIPDTQVKPGDSIEHIIAMGRYFAKHRPTRIIMIGDWWDMPSLSSYDQPGCEGWEYKDVMKDYEAGNVAMRAFMKELKRARGYKPDLHFCMGNHEERILRASRDPFKRQFREWLSYDMLDLKGWTVHQYQDIVELDGVHYSHLFINPESIMCSNLGGNNIALRIKKLGVSFVSGHEQRTLMGFIYNALGRRLRGLVSGAFYMHDEGYLGPQKNRQYWRGIYMLNEVKDGDYDLCEVSLGFLMRRYSGKKKGKS